MLALARVVLLNLISCSASTLYRMEVDDKEDGYKAQVSKLQREAEALVAQLKQQGSGMEAVGAASMEATRSLRMTGGLLNPRCNRFLNVMIADCQEGLR